MADVAVGSDSANITAINVVDQGSDPSAPGSGHVLLYVKGGVLYARGNAGSPSAVGAAPALTENRIGVGDGDDLLSALAQGDEGKILTAHGASVPTWEDPPEGGGGGGGSPLFVPAYNVTGYTGTAWSLTAISSAMLNGYISHASAAQNDTVYYDFWLAAGTYQVDILTHQSTGMGIATVALDGTTLGTIDMYAGVSAWNTTTTFTGATIAASGIKRLLLTMATKNGSSSGYNYRLGSVCLTRTA